jgi:lipoprotein-anchoring transpeptidase ErfK/SrfK
MRVAFASAVVVGLCVGLFPSLALAQASWSDGPFGFLRQFEQKPRSTRPPPSRRQASNEENPFTAIGNFFGDLSIQGNFSGTSRRIVSNPTGEPAGTIVVSTSARKLWYVQNGGRAVEYGIGVGRRGFEWSGTARVGRKAEWPDWVPPKEMLKRRPDLPRYMDGGIDNPLGARALYLYQGKRDTMFRIHGTNEANTIGQAVSSGCIRMLNADVVDLYERAPVGTRVIVR